jgi:hypothetical protein
MEDCSGSFRFSCANCDKTFSFNQGLYRHIKSGTCAVNNININTDEYIERMDFDMEELKNYDDINDLIFYILRKNDLSNLPFIIFNKRLRHIRIKVEDDKCNVDNSHYQLKLFFERIRRAVVRSIDKSILLKDNEESDLLVGFIKVMMSDLNTNTIIDKVIDSQ